MGADKQHAHELIERLAPSQLPAAVGMLEGLLDPLGRTLASAPTTMSRLARKKLAKSRQPRLRSRGEGIPNEQVLGEFGLTVEDFERMGRTPFKPNGSDR